MTLRDLLNASCRHDRYARNDELGVPFAVTFDFETMEAGPGGREMHDLVVWLLKEATMLLKVLEGFGFISDAYPLKFQHCNSLCTVSCSHAVSIISMHFSFGALLRQFLQAREVFKWSTTLTFSFSGSYHRAEQAM